MPMIMTSPSTLAQAEYEWLLGQIVELNDRMLEAARAHDWEELASIEGERNSLIADIFSCPIPPELGQRLAEGVREMLAANEELIDIVERARSAAAAALGNVQRGQKASLAYHQSSGTVP